MNSRGAMTWVNPNLLQRPSIMASMHHKAAKRDGEVMARPGTSSSSREFSRNASRTLSTGSGPLPLRADSLKPDIHMGEQDKLDVQVASEATSTRAGSPEDEDEEAIDDEEENMDLDQEDFEEREKQYVKDVDALRARMAPSPTSNPTLLVLLEELDALASAAEDLENGVVPPPKVEQASASTVPASMPTPPTEAPGIKKAEEPMHFKQEQENELVDLPLEGLPYLTNGIPTPISEFDFVDVKDCEEQLCQRIKESLAVENETDEDLRQEFTRLYECWRDEVEALDEERKALEEVEEKRAVTPLPEVPTETATTPAPQPEVTGRRGLFADDKDFQKILDLTKTENDMKALQQAQDAQERADPYREAPIPEMLTLEQQGVFMFEDVNNKINSASMLQVFGFIPPTDDFANDEQELFKEAYYTTPKKWGHIAEYINSAMAEIHGERGDGDKFRPRDFHDCIRHYYLTKKEVLYKNLLNRRGRKRKGMRGGRGKAAASALIGSAMVDDTTGSPNKLTETGRPRRQAAPEFNSKDKKENEGVGRGTTARTRGGGASMLNKSANESAPEKTPARRGRQANKERGGKRGGKPINLAPNVSPTKKPVDSEPTPMTEPSLNEGFQARDLETAQVLAGFSSTPARQPQPPVLFPQATQPEGWRVDAQAPSIRQAPQGPSILHQPAHTGDLAGHARVSLAPGQQDGPSGLQVQQQNSPPQVPPKLVAQGLSQLSLQQPRQPMGASQAQPGVAAQPPAASSTGKQSQGSRAAGSTSSYWSVQEQQDFEALVKHYGHDWEAIARELPLKTETMVSPVFPIALMCP